MQYNTKKFNLVFAEQYGLHFYSFLLLSRFSFIRLACLLSSFFKYLKAMLRKEQCSNYYPTVSVIETIVIIITDIINIHLTLIYNVIIGSDDIHE